jgi:hypothetical protein
VHRGAGTAAPKGGAGDYNEWLPLPEAEQGGGRSVELAAPSGRGCRHICVGHGDGDALRTHSRGTFCRAAGVAGTAWNKAQTVVARNLQAKEVVLRATDWEDCFWRFR